jgi:hypothetical protein
MRGLSQDLFLFGREAFRRNGEGLTNIFPAGKLPEVGEPAALSRLDRLNLACVFSLQKNAFVIRTGDDAETSTIREDFTIVLDEIKRVHLEKIGNRLNLLFLKTDDPRPATAVSAALAFVVNGIGIRG